MKIRKSETIKEWINRVLMNSTDSRNLRKSIIRDLDNPIARELMRKKMGIRPKDLAILHEIDDILGR